VLFDDGALGGIIDRDFFLAALLRRKRS